MKSTTVYKAKALLLLLFGFIGCHWVSTRFCLVLVKVRWWQLRLCKPKPGQVTSLSLKPILVYNNRQLIRPACVWIVGRSWRTWTRPPYKLHTERLPHQVTDSKPGPLCCEAKVISTTPLVQIVLRQTKTIYITVASHKTTGSAHHASKQILLAAR